MTDNEEAEICEENILYDYELMCKEEDLRYKDIEKELDFKIQIWYNYSVN